MDIRVEHLIDEIVIDNDVVERYNFVIYHFETNGLYCWARAYADDFRNVSVHGPFTNDTCRTQIADEAFFGGVIKYLKERFPNVRKLGQGGYSKIPD